MAIRVEQAHSLPLDAAKAAVGGFADFIKKYGVKLDWSGNNATLKGPGVSGDVQVTESKVVVSVKLGMLAKAAGVKEDKLEGSISRRLKEALVPEGS